MRYSPAFEYNTVECNKAENFTAAFSSRENRTHLTKDTAVAVSFSVLSALLLNISILISIIMKNSILQTVL